MSIKYVYNLLRVIIIITELEKEVNEQRGPEARQLTQMQPYLSIISLAPLSIYSDFLQKYKKYPLITNNYQKFWGTEWIDQMAEIIIIDCVNNMNPKYFI